MASGKALAASVGQFAYIAGAAVIGGLLFALTQSSFADGVWVALIVVFVYLGPIGIAAVLGLLLPALWFGVGFDQNGFYPAGLPVTAIVAALAATVNVVMARRWLAWRRARPTDAVERRYRGPGSIDHAIGAIFFVLSGCAFIALCFVAGWAAFLAHGVDTPVPPSRADPVELTAALTWWPGLALAIAGLILWIIRARRDKSLLAIAPIEFVLLVALIAIAVPAAITAGT